MLIKTASEIPSLEITDEKCYLRRREFIRTLSGAATGLVAGVGGAARLRADDQRPPKLEGIRKGPFGTTEEPTPW
ncbi:MAG: hypothetical protein IMZ44_22085 [Planctomycetes bacterium]|nr:hypothetical protein [Planctomycetota bacterium]